MKRFEIIQRKKNQPISIVIDGNSKSFCNFNHTVDYAISLINDGYTIADSNISLCDDSDQHRLIEILNIVR